MHFVQNADRTWSPCDTSQLRLLALYFVSGVSRAKIEEVTLNALRTRQSLVKGERLVRHEMRAVLHMVALVRTPEVHSLPFMGFSEVEWVPPAFHILHGG